MTQYRITTKDADGHYIGHTHRDDEMAALLEVGNELKFRRGQTGVTITIEVRDTPGTT